MANPTSIIPVPPNNTSIIIHQDNSAFPTGIILNETNYLLWSILMEMCIGTRNKAGYLIGETKKPHHEDSTFTTWTIENQKNEKLAY